MHPHRADKCMVLQSKHEDGKMGKKEKKFFGKTTDDLVIFFFLFLDITFQLQETAYEQKI